MRHPSPEDQRMCWLPTDRYSGRSVSPNRKQKQLRPKTAPNKRPIDNDKRKTLLSNLRSAETHQRVVFERDYGTHKAKVPQKRRPKSAHSESRVTFEGSPGGVYARPKSALATRSKSKSPAKVAPPRPLTLNYP